jgi:hypothetical protein
MHRKSRWTVQSTAIGQDLSAITVALYRAISGPHQFTVTKDRDWSRRNFCRQHTLSTRHPIKRALSSFVHFSLLSTITINSSYVWSNKRATKCSRLRHFCPWQPVQDESAYRHSLGFWPHKVDRFAFPEFRSEKPMHTFFIFGLSRASWWSRLGRLFLCSIIKMKHFWRLTSRTWLDLHSPLVRHMRPEVAAPLTLANLWTHSRQPQSSTFVCSTLTPLYRERRSFRFLQWDTGSPTR